jgi:DHA1 family bicyclomycin/chloramphenicol resistance-like MFS transporter
MAEDEPVTLAEDHVPRPAHVTRSRRPRHAVIGGREFLGLVAGCMAMAAVGIDLLLPAFPEMREEFGLAPDSTRVALLITAFFVGLAAGQIVYGPLSDRFGRKPMLYAGLSIYVTAAAAAAFAPSLNWLIVCRVVWGMGAAAPRSLAVAMVRDSFEGERMARTMSLVMATFISVPVIAPTIGAGIIAIFGWRSVFWFQFAIALVLVVWLRRLPETLPAERRRSVSPRALGEAFRSVLHTRQSMGFGLAVTFMFGVMSSYIASSEIIIDDVFGQEDLFPVFFGLLAVVMGAGSLLNARIVGRIGLHRLVRLASLGAVAATGLFALVATLTDGKPPFGVFLALTSLVLLGNSILLPNANTAAMQRVPHVAGMAAAVIGTFSTGGGALLGAIVDAAFDGTIRAFAYGAFAFTCAAAVCVNVVAGPPPPPTERVASGG